jgi:aromatic ring-cleaving dioxygenase
VLIHPLTDSSYDDHTKYAIWLGRPVALKTTGLRGYRPEQHPSAAG